MVSLTRRRKLPRSFYLRPTLTVAKDLLGKYLVRKLRGKTLVGKIVEVEAYLGERDPASHAFRGRTARNDVMFREGGHLYVYFTYGMHFCCNVVTERKGRGRAVLIRAIEPVEGVGLMVRNRIAARGAKLKSGAERPHARSTHLQLTSHYLTSHHSDPALTNGPAKLCQAFGIEREQNGTDLLGEQIYIINGESISPSRIAATTRIGIKNGKQKKWRYSIRKNPFVSMKATP